MYSSDDPYSAISVCPPAEDYEYLNEMDLLELGTRAAIWLFVAADTPSFMLARAKEGKRVRDYGTSGGVKLTEPLIERLADEAEDYDPDRKPLRINRRG